MSPAQENELLCEKVLGWRRHYAADNSFTGNWHTPDGFIYETVDFLNWGWSGLLLEAIAPKVSRLELDLADYETKDGQRWSCGYVRVYDTDVDEWYWGASAPEAIRAMALGWMERQMP